MAMLECITDSWPCWNASQTHGHARMHHVLNAVDLSMYEDSDAKQHAVTTDTEGFLEA